MQQPLAQRLRLPCEFPLRFASRLQRVEGEGHIAIFVVDERAGDAAGEVRRFVLHLLARLVELGLDLGRWRIVAQRQRGEGEARPGEGFSAVIPAQFLQPLFERLRDLVLHFLRSGAGPARHDRDGLDGEARIFSAAEAEESDDPGDRDDDDEEERHRALAHGERGQVEAALRLRSVIHRTASMRTTSPWWSMCAPSATKRSPGWSPAATTAVSSLTAASLTGRQLTVPCPPATQTPAPWPRS